MYLRFLYSGKNQMWFAVFWRISVRFCGFRTLLTPPSFLTLPLTLYSDDSPYIHCIRTLGAGETRKRMRVLQVINLEKNPTIYSCGCNLKCFSLLRSINSNMSSHCLLQLWYIQLIIASISPVKMCRQPAIWPLTTKYLLLTSHLSDLYSGRACCLLPITIASLPTTQKHFDWAAKWYWKCSCCGCFVEDYILRNTKNTFLTPKWRALLSFLYGIPPHQGLALYSF